MANPKPGPSQGRFAGGKRNSRLLTKRAVPPTGKPESGSRGPASFNPNPRKELAPPAKNCSGSGMVSIVHVGSSAAFKGHVPGDKTLVPPNGCSSPIVVDRANTNWCPGFPRNA